MDGVENIAMAENSSETVLHIQPGSISNLALATSNDNMELDSTHITTVQEITTSENQFQPTLEMSHAEPSTSSSARRPITKRRNNRSTGSFAKRANLSQTESVPSCESNDVIETSDNMNSITIRRLDSNKIQAEKSSAQSIIHKAMNESKSYEEIPITKEISKLLEQNQEKLKHDSKSAIFEDFSSEINFKIAVYRKTTKSEDNLSAHFKLDATSTYQNELRFYFREKPKLEILYVGIGQGWREVKKLACPFFPQEIRNSLCSDISSQSCKYTNLVDGRHICEEFQVPFQIDRLENAFTYVEHEVGIQPKLQAFKRGRKKLKLGFTTKHVHVANRFSAHILPEMFWFFSRHSNGINSLRNQGDTAELQCYGNQVYIQKILRGADTRLENILAQYVRDAIVAFAENSDQDGTTLTNQFILAPKEFHAIKPEANVRVYYGTKPLTGSVPSQLSDILGKISNDLVQECKSKENGQLKNVLDNLYIEYDTRYGSQCTKKLRFMTLLQGELFDEEHGQCWKLDGHWHDFSDEYLQMLEAYFSEILKDFLVSPERRKLTKLWNLHKANLWKTSILNYAYLYKENDAETRHFFVPMQGNSKIYLFDMMSVDNITSDIPGAVTFYYLFSGLTAQIRQKFLEMETAIKNIFDSDRKAVKQFWREQDSPWFQANYPNYEQFFHQVLKNENVSVVMGFVARDKTISLQREKHLVRIPECGNDIQRVEAMSKILENVSQEKRLELAAALQCSTQITDLSTTLFKKMQNGGFITNDGQFSGKFLKLRERSQFRLLDNANKLAGDILFDAIKLKCLTGFPDLLPKLIIRRLNRGPARSMYKLEVEEILLQNYE